MVQLCIGFVIFFPILGNWGWELALEWRGVGVWDGGVGVGVRVIGEVRIRV